MKFKVSLVILCLGCVFLSACGRTVVVYETRPEVTPEKLVIQEAKIINNPLSNELINCPVTNGVAVEDNPWVKVEGEQVEFINIIERDSDDRMWLATDGHGLSMFDGQEWHNWQPETRNDMSDDALRTMAVSDGKVFVGAYSSSSGGNLLIYHTELDNWETIEPDEGSLSGNVIGGLAINQEGQLFAATQDSINIYHDSQWIKFDIPDTPQFAMLLVQDGLFDSKGNYWLATGQLTGIWKYDGKSWATFTADKGYLPSNQVTALAVDSKDRIWTGTTNGVAVYSESSEWHVFSGEKFPWFNDWIQDIAVDSEDRVWVVSNDLLIVYNGKEIAKFEPSVIGENLWGNAIGFDQYGCVWVDNASSRLAILRGGLNMEAGKFSFQ